MLIKFLSARNAFFSGCRIWFVNEWQRPRQLALGLGLLLALVPMGYTLQRASEAWRDVAYWDEISTAVAMLVRLDAGASFREILGELFAVSNEHRMVTSRLIYAASYWLTGTVNFTVIGIIGVAMIVILFGALVTTAGSTARRVRMAVLLGGLLFQLEHFENFFWSGASIDHFQVVLFAALAVIGATRGTTGGVAGGAGCALLATFTLAHGALAWPAGALVLWLQGRRRAFAVWCVFTALVAGGFLTGFHLNTAQSFALFSVEGVLDIFTFWLRLLGAVPALDYGPLEPLLGAGLLALIYKAVRGGAARREFIALPVALFAVGALGLIAIGRTAESSGVVSSRYYVLGALAWALTLGMLLSRYTTPRAPLRLILFAVPALAAFNVAANATFADKAGAWVESRDRAASRYKRHGVDGMGPFKLFPIPSHSSAILAAAERTGVYNMGQICRPIAFPKMANETGRLHYMVEKLEVDRQAVYVEGWAAFPHRESETGQIHLLLRSANETFAFTTVSMTRDDVAKTHAPEPWLKSGFRFVRRRERLPAGDFQIGLLFIDGDKREYTWTAHRVVLKGDGEAKVAPGNFIPLPSYSSALLAAAERTGTSSMGQMGRPIAFPQKAQETGQLHYFVEKLEVDRQALYVEGWAAFRQRESKEGQIHLVLRSPNETFAFTTESMARPDVANAHAPEPWLKSGFRFIRRRERMPTGEFQVGFLLIDGDKSEFTWTTHRVILKGEGEAKLATGQ